MTFFRPAPKPAKPLKSPQIRNSARDKRCTLRLPGCLPGTETVVLAHIRWKGFCGVSQKPHDIHAIYACKNCHDIQESRNCTSDDVLRAMMETQSIMLENGLIQIGKS